MTKSQDKHSQDNNPNEDASTALHKLLEDHLQHVASGRFLEVMHCHMTYDDGRHMELLLGHPNQVIESLGTVRDSLIYRLATDQLEEQDQQTRENFAARKAKGGPYQ